MGYSTKSEKKKSVLPFVILGVVFLMGYMIFFPQILGRDFYFYPNKIHLLNQSSVLQNQQQLQFPFLDTLGYWDPLRKQVQFLNPLPGLKAGSQGYSYTEAPNETVLISSKGNKIVLSDTRQLNWIANRAFHITEDRLVLMEYDLEGKVLWKINMGVPITSLDANSSQTLVGLLDGRIGLLDAKGALSWEYRPSASRIEVIYNSILSKDGMYLVLISGVDPKRVVLIEKMGEGYRPVLSKPIEDQRRHPTPMGFLADDTYFFYDYGSGVIVKKLDGGWEWDIPLSGALFSASLDPIRQLFTSVSYDRGRLELSVVSLAGDRLVSIPFQSKRFDVKELEKYLFLGLEDRVMEMEKSL